MQDVEAPSQISEQISISYKQYEQLIHLLQQSNVNQQSSTSSNQVHSFLPNGRPSIGKPSSSFSYSISCHNFTLDSWIID